MRLEPEEQPPLTWVDDLITSFAAFVVIAAFCLGGFAVLLVIGVIGKFIGIWS